MRDLVGYANHPPFADWPGGARIALQFALNYEEGSESCVADGDERNEVGLADAVAFPADAEQIGRTVAAAVRHGIPVTPRGKGTGNYGQAIPMPGGLVVDLSRARAVVEVGDGWVTAEAGATMVALEAAARNAGARTLVLDTNRSLEAAGGLYRATGFVPVPPFNDNPNATDWYAKRLDG